MNASLLVKNGEIQRVDGGSQEKFFEKDAVKRVSTIATLLYHRLAKLLTPLDVLPLKEPQTTYKVILKNASMDVIDIQLNRFYDTLLSLEGKDKDTEFFATVFLMEDDTLHMTVNIYKRG